MKTMSELETKNRMLKSEIKNLERDLQAQFRLLAEANNKVNELSDRLERIAKLCGLNQ